MIVFIYKWRKNAVFSGMAWWGGAAEDNHSGGHRYAYASARSAGEYQAATLALVSNVKEISIINLHRWPGDDEGQVADAVADDDGEADEAAEGGGGKKSGKKKKKKGNKKKKGGKSDL